MKLRILVTAAPFLLSPVTFGQTTPLGENANALSADSTTAAMLDHLPLRFVENVGQWDTPARFVARRGCMAARLETRALIMELRKEEGSEAGGVVIRLGFEGASDDVELVGQERLAGVSNFFLGSDREEWRAGVPAFGSILYRGLYEGIDLRLYEAEDWLEYDLLLAPNAELSQFSVTCDGVDSLELESDGTLVMFTELGPLEQSPPLTWALLPSGERRALECEFVLLSERCYGFKLPARQEGLPVVIDPQLRWSTFLGGSNWESVGYPNALAIAANGEVLVTGSTWSMNFPTRNGIYPGPLGSRDAFVSRLEADGSDLVWSTYFGGANEDEGRVVICDELGKVLVGGWTLSTNFPATTGAPYVANQGGEDAFLSRISGNGSLLEWSTYLGGTSDDGAADILPDGPGIFLAVGSTHSQNFPTTAGVIQPNLAGDGDAYICRIDTTLAPANQIVWSTYLGGTDSDIGHHLAFDATGDVTVGGWTASTDLQTTANAYQQNFGGGAYDHFLGRVDCLGTAVRWLTYLGGVGDEIANGMDVDFSTGQVVAGGWTNSPGFPVTSNAYDQTFGGDRDAYVSCLDPNEPPASQLLWSTYLGGSSDDGSNSVALGNRGEILVIGTTNSGDFPSSPDAFDTTHNGDFDGFLARFDRTLTGAQQLTYCTFLGHSAADVLINVQQRPDDSVILAGWTRSPGFPTTAGAYDVTHNGFQDITFSCLAFPTRAYCFGIGCPCGNDDPLGGCANSTWVGAALVPIGSASVVADDLAFQGRVLLPGQAALLFVANNAVNGGTGIPFGDGLRCAGGGLIRLGVQMPDAAGRAGWGPGLAAAGGWTSGDVRRFQIWYRDPVGSPCTTGFNLSHGIEVEFMP